MIIDPVSLFIRHLWGFLATHWEAMSWASKVQWLILAWLIRRDNKRQKFNDILEDILVKKGFEALLHSDKNKKKNNDTDRNK